MARDQRGKRRIETVGFSMIRLAELRDEVELLALRNSVTSRFWSTHSDLISPDEHHTWLTRALENPEREVILVLEEQDTVQAYARFQVIGNTGTVAIAVNPMIQRRGHGTTLLHVLEQQACRVGVEQLVAHVHVSNYPAIKIFMDSEYIRKYLLGEWLTLIRWISK